MDWAKSMRQLGQVRAYEYFREKSMPEFVEPLVTELTMSFPTYDDSEKNELSSAISTEALFVLGWYARKLAGRSVRESSRADLWKALMALAISTSNGDARDILAPLALVYHSASRLGENPETLFETAAEVSPQSVKNLFHEFLIRPANQKSIYTFGFAEGKGPLGFDYLPLLPEYGGPTPFDSGGL